LVREHSVHSQANSRKRAGVFANDPTESFAHCNGSNAGAVGTFAERDEGSGTKEVGGRGREGAIEAGLTESVKSLKHRSCRPFVVVEDIL
jgi:hypothetical protein